jgi:anthranilate phosphoribosyltransferase
MVVAGLAADLKDGIARAQQALDSGAAFKVLNNVVAISNGKAVN